MKETILEAILVIEEQRKQEWQKGFYVNSSSLQILINKLKKILLDDSKDV